jgi:DNA-binding winged helix-turn-helix (wHTH) protein
MIINDRFEVDRLRGEVTDRQTGTISRVEPRLVKLLCLLADQREKPVSREMIV